MIKINNNIDKKYKAKIYYKDKYIGECLNELAFLDVRVQIAKEQDENYSFELIGINNNTGCVEISDRYKFNKNGKPIHPMSYNLYWASYEKMLNILVGF